MIFTLNRTTDDKINQNSSSIIFCVHNCICISFLQRFYCHILAYSFLTLNFSIIASLPNSVSVLVGSLPNHLKSSSLFLFVNEYSMPKSYNFESISLRLFASTIKLFSIIFYLPMCSFRNIFQFAFLKLFRLVSSFISSFYDILLITKSDIFGKSIRLRHSIDWMRLSCKFSFFSKGNRIFEKCSKMVECR